MLCDIPELRGLNKNSPQMLFVCNDNLNPQVDLQSLVISFLQLKVSKIGKLPVNHMTSFITGDSRTKKNDGKII